MAKRSRRNVHLVLRKTKLACLIVFLTLPFLLAEAQNQESSAGRPSAIVQVQRDSLGANLVKIAISNPKYPPKLLVAQVERIGALCGGGSRGVQVTDNAIDPAKPDESRVLRVVFAVDGLIGKRGEWLRIGPIVKGLAGAPAPDQLTDLLIDFDYERINPADLDAFNSGAVAVNRRVIDRSIEYSVHLKSQNPDEIKIPDQSVAKPVPPSLTKNSPDILTLTTIIVGILAAAILVYCLFLLAPNSRRRKNIK